MRLYHGSNVRADAPRILPEVRRLDFGNGFYLTSSHEQAARWARRVALRRKTGRACVNVYSVDIHAYNLLEILRFDFADEAWLDYVVANRKGLPCATGYDVVFGPVANDSTLPVINDYTDGIYPKHIAIELLQPQNLTNQHAFLTPRALACLTFTECELL